eukprot:TRINITY_DN1488_c0_g2_i1.p1 TRINITY_DN1488_c0_g2~~TRINITY_DN1488_c0_g2_i1.p1  ORF type:complete len:596 (+),score=89.31 TRINITY_DN1488_c0_g2_i1:96-1883(+)
MSGYRHNPYEKVAAGGGGGGSAEPFPSGDESVSCDVDPRLLAFRKAEAEKVGGGPGTPFDSPTASMNEGVTTSYGYLQHAISSPHNGRVGEGAISPNGTFASDMPLLGTFSAPAPDQATSPSRSASPGYRHNPYGDKPGEAPNSTFGSAAEGLSPPINPAHITAATATFSSDMMPVLGTFSDGRQSPSGVYSGSPPPPAGAPQEVFGMATEGPDPRLLEFQARARALAEGTDIPPSLDNTFNSDVPFRHGAPPLVIPSSRDSSPYNSFSNNASFSQPPFLPPQNASPCLSPTHDDATGDLMIMVHKDPNDKLGFKWAGKYLQLAGVKQGTPGCANGIERAFGKTLTHVNDIPVTTTKDFVIRTAGLRIVKLTFSSNGKRQQKLLYQPKVDSPQNNEGANAPLRVPPAPPLPPQLTDQPPAAELPTAVTILFKYGRKAEFATKMTMEEVQQVQGEYWLVEAAKGVDLGLVSVARRNADESRIPQYRVVRPANLDELRLWENDRVEEEKRACMFVVDKAKKLKAPVTIHRTEFQLDRLKLTIHYSSAVNKPDFRQLLHDSFREFKCRIWMNNCQPAAGQPGDSLDLEANTLPRSKIT